MALKENEWSIEKAFKVAWGIQVSSEMPPIETYPIFEKRKGEKEESIITKGNKGVKLGTCN